MQRLQHLVNSSRLLQSSRVSFSEVHDLWIEFMFEKQSAVFDLCSRGSMEVQEETCVKNLLVKLISCKDVRVRCNLICSAEDIENWGKSKLSRAQVLTALLIRRYYCLSGGSSFQKFCARVFTSRRAWSVKSLAF